MKCCHVPRRHGANRGRARATIARMFGYNDRTCAARARSQQVRLPRPAAASSLAGTVALSVFALAGCGGGTSGGGPGPTPQPPLVSAITPDAGSTAGNTLVTITGLNFASGATVTIAGEAATGVAVESASKLTAHTAARNAGSGDVVVTVNGVSGRLANGFTYAFPGPSNNPAPVIKDLTAHGPRRNQPAGMADIGESLTLTATVTDGETPVENLGFDWSVAQGTVSGSGPSVTWTAPAQATTPLSVEVRLTVTERYVTNDTAVPEVRENKVTVATTIDVHDSVKEVGDMATRFLENFSQTSIPTSVVVQDFLPGCYGTDDERQDVEDNRQSYTITSWSVGPPSVTVDFAGTCAFRARPGDACSNSDVRWESTKNSTGEPGGAMGVDQVAAVYRQRRWWLCDSQFDGKPITTSRGFYELLAR